MTPRLRPATRSDIIEFYGSVKWTFRAFAADLDGKVLAVGGIYYDGGNRVAFSSMRNEMRRFPVTIMKGAKLIMTLLDKPTIAIANPTEPGAPRLLERLGFEPRGNGVYEWLTR